MSFFDDAIGSLGQSLAKSATSFLSDTTGYDIGGTLGFLFGNDQTYKGENLANIEAEISNKFTGDQLKLIQGDLNNQTAQIGRIGEQLNTMATAISDIYGEIKGIENLLQQINQQQLYLSWQAQDNQIKNYIVKIDSTFTVYAEYVATDTTKVDDVKMLVTSILNPNDGEITASRGINNFMLSDQQNKGALQLWAEMTCSLIEAGLLDYRQAVDQYKAYYTKLVWAQLRATNLVMEAYLFKNDNDLANKQWLDYKALILSQENEFIGNLISIVRSGYVGAITIISIDHIRNDYLAYHAAGQLHPDLPSATLYKNDKFLSVYYEPSSIFRSAETLLAKLSLTDPGDRRMVVHMTYFGHAFKTAIDSATITLDLKNSGDSVKPSSTKEYGPLASPDRHSTRTTAFDANWNTDDKFYVKRLVYAGSTSTPLGDGVYQLTNLNGDGSLIPLETYLGKVPFQSDAVLEYAMEINTATNFDYMNFAAYFSN